MANNSGFDNLLNEVNKMKKDLDKSSSFLMKNFTEITKKFDFKKEKKGKVNKKSATMFLNIDNSVVITFDDPNDGIKFFEGIK